MTNYNKFFEEQMKDAAFRKEWEALQPEMAIVQAMIDAREKTGMTQKEFRAFVGTLVPMKGHGDKRNINANYRKILDAGFRCNRKLHCYENSDWFRIIWKYRADGVVVWCEL